MLIQAAGRQITDAKLTHKTLIIARQDFFVDGIVRILNTSAIAGNIVCVSPGEPCMRHFVGSPPDFLLVQEDSRPEPVEDFISGMVKGFPGMHVLVFGQSMPDDYLYRIIQSGAHGYFNEKMNAEHILMGLEAVSNGGYWAERHIMERFISDQSLLDGIQNRVRKLDERLTVREAEVLELIMQGLSTGEIAERIFLSNQGVKAHLTTLFRKFNVKNRSQLILAVLDEVSPVKSITGLFRQALQDCRQQEQPVAAQR
ncbi:MAG: response regulator transcription factor [Gammaproteobacteria bacterium]|nr:response regulator transcription factor [Gammaproteobacteria bacterium]